MSFSAESEPFHAGIILACDLANIYSESYGTVEMPKRVSMPLNDFVAWCQVKVTDEIHDAWDWVRKRFCELTKKELPPGTILWINDWD